MAGAPSARPFVPDTRELAALREAAMGCRGCDLYKDATQTVFGDGPPDARLVFVGEQPGDSEDRRGLPFVGPAGEVFDRALAQAGLERSSVYVTNAVKHFKFIVQRGGRRIHQTPRAVEIGACRPWLEAELAAIRPQLLVCLGATASKALLGPEFRLMKERGRFMAQTGWAPKVMATLHPSAVLRGETTSAQEALYGLLLGDLRMVAGALAASAPG
ncbi:MAG: UdgX family uracil-DNA binding protein [Thermoanaerobaculia bacterium]